MPFFRVHQEFSVAAASPVDAARTVRDLHRTGAHLSNFFHVSEMKGAESVEDEDAPLGPVMTFDVRSFDEEEDNGE